MKSTKTQILLFASTLAPATIAQWLGSFVGGMEAILKLLVPVLVGIALVLFLWGVVVFIKKSGNEKTHEEAKKRIVWGLIILFVIIATWGLVGIAQTIFNVGGPGVIVAPFIQYSS